MPTGAIVISSGEELLNGLVVDTNAPYLAQQLSSHGFRLVRHITVGDDPEHLTSQLRSASKDCKFILVTGGLGPTADDRSRAAVAEAAGTELVEDADTVAHLRLLFRRRHGSRAVRANLRQALFPRGAHIFPNPVGTARGFACSVGNARVVVMPGVPGEMRAMLKETVLPYLLEQCPPRETVAVRVVNIFGLPESEVDSRIADLSVMGRNPSVGITAVNGVIRVGIRARAGQPSAAEKLAEQDARTVLERFPLQVFGFDETSLAEALAGLLQKRKLTLSAAESCTGGLLGHMLSDVPGISQSFMADVVAYSNESKVRQLGVSGELIERFGAVSPEVAEAMAEGICRVTRADVGLSTTGIAGPAGGAPQKPVGLVYVGLCLEGKANVEKLLLHGDRWTIKDRAAKHALNFARLALLRMTSDAQGGEPGGL